MTTDSSTEGAGRCPACNKPFSKSTWDEESFMEAIDIPINAYECWSWTKSKNGKGYPQKAIYGGVVPVSRITFALHNLVDSKTMDRPKREYAFQLKTALEAIAKVGRLKRVKHCDNKDCVNPQHWESANGVHYIAQECERIEGKPAPARPASTQENPDFYYEETELNEEPKPYYPPEMENLTVMEKLEWAENNK